MRKSKKSTKPAIQKPIVCALEDIEFHKWFERDRAHIEIRHKETQETILEFWDDSVREMIEDGFISPKDYKGTLIKYAIQMSFLKLEES